jgi:hypothetical protein
VLAIPRIGRAQSQFGFNGRTGEIIGDPYWNYQIANFQRTMVAD